MAKTRICEFLSDGLWVTAHTACAKYEIKRGLEEGWIPPDQGRLEWKSIQPADCGPGQICGVCDQPMQPYRRKVRRAPGRRTRQPVVNTAYGDI